MSDITAEEVQTFIDELQALSEKHDIWVSSCGCCDAIYFLSKKHDGWLDATDGELRYHCSGRDLGNLSPENWRGRGKWNKTKLVAGEPVPEALGEDE